MRSPLEKGEGHWAWITKCFRCIGSAHRAVSLAEDLAEHLEHMEELDVLARFPWLHLEKLPCWQSENPRYFWLLLCPGCSHPFQRWPLEIAGACVRGVRG